MKTNYHIDKFVDDTGVEREFILAAVSIDLDKDNILSNAYAGVETETYYGNYPIDKVLCIGIAVRRIEDVYNEALGMKIAEGKALKALTHANKGKLIFVSDSGLVNTRMVQALLEQEALYFKRDPRSYIAGYGKKRTKK